jgi:hypothetical protein
MGLVMKLSVISKFLIIGGIIAGLSAIWHLLCIIGGPSWLAFARAPAAVIESSRQGTLLAPIAAVIIAGLMFACTAYAFSSVGLIRKIPLLKSALVTISLICLLRGLIVVPRLVEISFSDTWQVVASSVWFFVGVCFLMGSVEQFRRKI